MKFKFPLQTVVRHRKIKEDLAQKDYLEAQALLNTEIGKLKKMEEDLHNAHLRAGLLVQQGGAQGPALTQIFEFRKGQDVRIEMQKAKVQEFEKLVEAKQEILRQAALEYKIIEKLREKKFEEYKAERIATDQKEADEQSILRFRDRTGHGEK